MKRDQPIDLRFDAAVENDASSNVVMLRPRADTAHGTFPCGYPPVAVRSELADVVEPADEAEYYRQLLDLAFEDEPEPMLRRALGLLLGLLGARRGHIELDDPADVGGPIWSASAGYDEAQIAEIRSSISRGIVGEALATGETVLTASAVLDPRFEDRESVKKHAIEAVICAPLGSDEPLGFVYLEGHGEALSTSAAEAKNHVAYFARAIAPFLERLLEQAREAMGREDDGPFSAVRHRSAAMARVVERLRLAAPLDVDVLLVGPTGVGKTLLAQCVHAASGRSGRLVELNCAAIPPALFENELFGAVEGAHSSVPRSGVEGKVEAADGGTLFLDEIAEMDLASQAKLLQLLQSRTFYRLGSSELRRADVRVIAATNVDLRERVEAQRFREDLFYRLNVLEARVPPLSERSEDLPMLARSMVLRAAARHGIPIKGLSAGGLREILQAEWPGNVRELGNRIESAVLNAHLRNADHVEPVDIFPDAWGEEEHVYTLQEATRRFQKKHVLSVLESTDWNVSEAARILSVARSHVYNLIRRHGLRGER